MIPTTYPKPCRHHVGSLFLLASVASALLVSCVPRPQPLGALGPQKIGPVSCQLDPRGANNPQYSNSWSNAAKDQAGNSNNGLVASLIMAGISEAARAPGQAKLTKISQASGGQERQQILANVRKQLVAAGYTVRDGAPSTFVVNVSYYGMYKGLSGNAQQGIIGCVSLNDSAGKNIWTINSGTAATAAQPGRKFEEYEANPNLYRTDFEEAAKNFAYGAVTGNGIFSSAYDPSKAAPQ